MITNFTAEELQANYNKLISFIDRYITGDRQQKLKQLYEDHAERIALMPASSIDHHHNAFTGGYVDHVIRVIECALQLKQLWSSMGSDINYTEEELVFAALNHDLGKIGTEEAEQYIPNDSEWHRKNLGKLYKYNPINAFMTVPDRSIFLLQQRGISVSYNEYIGIKLHDGLYEEANKAYYISNSKESKLRCNLPILLHHADHMASRIEFEKWNKETAVISTPQPKANLRPNIPANMSETEKNDLMNVFDNLFKTQ
jgi:hypothetical protein